MTKMRVIETNEGIQAPPTAELFDQFAKGMRDKGWQGVDSMLASGLPAGDLLELGPGPGYVGLELAKQPPKPVDPKPATPTTPVKPAPQKHIKTVYRQAAFPSKTLESQADIDAYVERMRAYLNAMLKDCDGIKLN